MKPGLAQNTAKSAKTLAQNVARQMAREPLEVLKTAGSQVAGETPMQQDSFPHGQTPDTQAKIIQNQRESADRMKSGRRMEAYQRELDDIRKQNVFKDLQSRIAQGIVVPLEDYPELTMEQKQVLRAQEEAVEFQKKQAEYVESKKGGLPTVKSKPSRRFGHGQKQEAEKQQTRVEKPVPPSG